MLEKKQFLQRAGHFGSGHFGSTLRSLFCRRACCKGVIADENMWMVTVSLVWLRDLVDGVGVASWGRVESEASDKGLLVVE